MTEGPLNGRDRVATRRRHALPVVDWLGWRTETSIGSFVIGKTPGDCKSGTDENRIMQRDLDEH